jgi:hypothetical protein
MLTAFGLDIACEQPLSLLAPARARATGRRLRVELVQQSQAASLWPDGARRICVRSDRAGEPLFTIDEHPRAGYRVWGRDRGSYILDAAASRLLCVPDQPRSRSWERFLVGQVLPFAALLSGLEIFHASAVTLDGSAIALAGPSGAGKTSVALALCELGASFLADDVLALEPTGEVLMAHPGSPVAGVDRGEERRLRSVGRPLPEQTLGGDARERLLPMSGASQPAPLQALFFLDRISEQPAGGADKSCGRVAGIGSSDCVRFASVAQAPLLLAATFNFALDSRPRMRRLLEVCSLAASGRVERVTIPDGIDAGDVAVAVRERLRGES